MLVEVLAFRTHLISPGDVRFLVLKWERSMLPNLLL